MCVRITKRERRIKVRNPLAFVIVDVDINCVAQERSAEVVKPVMRGCAGPGPV